MEEKESRTKIQAGRRECPAPESFSAAERRNPVVEGGVGK